MAYTNGRIARRSPLPACGERYGDGRGHFAPRSDQAEFGLTPRLVALAMTGAVSGSIALGSSEGVFGPHRGFGRLDAGLGWLTLSAGGIRGNQLLAQHSNITIGRFMNINMTTFIVREQRSGRCELSATRE